MLSNQTEKVPFLIADPHLNKKLQDLRQKLLIELISFLLAT